MRRLTLLFIGIVCLAAAAAQSTQVLYRTPQQLGAESDLVVHGRVSAVRSYWNQDHTKILTEASVAVEESFKGDAVSTVRVVQLGGVVGHVRMTVHGALQWRAGEEVVLFLEPATPGAYQVSGFTQGKYHVERDADDGRAYVRRAAQTDVELVGATSDAELPARSQIQRVTLRQFINDALKTQR
jgi:hypothetical protein